jgi:hypothetical protein
MSDEKSAIVLRSADRVNESTFERIWKFYYDQSDLRLKPKEEEIRQRLINIWGHLSDILTDRKAVLAHMKWCEGKGYSVRESIAYEDLRYAKMLFGDRTKQSKAAQRAISSEILLNCLHDAIKKKRFMSAARLIKEYNELNDLKNHSDGNEPGEWKPIRITLNGDPETLRKQVEVLRRKAEKVNAVDIPHEDI